MIQKENRPYPYLFKDAGYKYEEEIRFVFGVHPNLLANANGIVTEIDGKSLLQGVIRERQASRVLISPEIPWDERVVIRRLVADIVAGVRPAPIYPEGPDDERLEAFKTVSGNPFTITDDPADLFADLD
jgi:hypothetical protein